VKRISLFARDSRDMREKRDGSEVSSSRVAPVAHVLLVSLTTHERRTKRSDFWSSLRVKKGSRQEAAWLAPDGVTLLLPVGRA